jgi:hypothetical protein
MLFSPTIEAGITAGYWYLWVRCPGCRTMRSIDLRTLDRHRDAVPASNSEPDRDNVRLWSIDPAGLHSHDGC